MQRTNYPAQRQIAIVRVFVAQSLSTREDERSRGVVVGFGSRNEMQGRLLFHEWEQGYEIMSAGTQVVQHGGRQGVCLLVDATRPRREHVVRPEHFAPVGEAGTANQGAVIEIGAVRQTEPDAHAVVHLVVRRSQRPDAMHIEFAEMVALAFVLVHIGVFEKTGAVEIIFQFERAAFHAADFEHAATQQAGGDVLQSCDHSRAIGGDMKRRKCGLKFHRFSILFSTKLATFVY